MRTGIREVPWLAIMKLHERINVQGSLGSSVQDSSFDGPVYASTPIRPDYIISAFDLGVEVLSTLDFRNPTESVPEALQESFIHLVVDITKDLRLNCNDPDVVAGHAPERNIQVP